MNIVFSTKPRSIELAITIDHIAPPMPIKELTGALPLTFKTVDNALLDWRIRGAAGGVGKTGVNLLPQREYALSDGLSNGSLDPSYLGNIEIEFYPGGTATTHDVPAIPPGTPNTGEYQQWIGMEPGGYVNDYWTIDERTNHLYPPNFQNAQWKTTLPAGSYKLHCELIQIKNEIGWFADIYDRGEDWKNYTSVDLITSAGTVLIHRNVESTSYAPSEDVLFANYRANYGPAFFHEEIPFTLSEETEIGMITKLYWYYNRRGDIYFRFYITDASVVAQPFNDGTYSGVTAWEPYRVTLPLTISCGEQSTAISVDLGTEFLGENDTISFTTTHTAIPTYNGTNTITADTDIQPSEMYIKYRKY